MRNKYLLGSTKEKEIVFAEIEITTRNGYKKFSVSFDTVHPFNGTNFDFEEYYKYYIDELDKPYLYDLCCQYDCCPSELAENLASECDDPTDALDCSLYPECFDINGQEWYFESMSCGQHDTREEMEVIINKPAYDKLHYLWDNYHLKEINEDIISQIENVKSQLIPADSVNADNWIISYIVNNMM